jgi:CBS domain containing-hemolysin-like protein
VHKKELLREHLAGNEPNLEQFMGVLSMTDILESIAGELPDASETPGRQV